MTGEERPLDALLISQQKKEAFDFYTTSFESSHFNLVSYAIKMSK